MNGFNTFYPDSISKNPFIPNLVFTSFYKTRGNSREYVNLGEPGEIILKYNVNSFTVEFAALEFTNPEKNRYSYQMEGISDDWIDIGNRRFVPFSGLQPGKYIFKVRGSNNDGVWNNNAIRISIVVLPPWWNSVYAYIFYLVFIVLSVFAFIKMRERKLLHDREILKQKVHERTLQIEEKNRLIVSKNQELKELNHTKDKLFSVIGHDLGNQFNIILGFLEVLVSDFKKLDSAKVENHLNNISKSANHAYDLLENLLTWSRMQTKSIHYNPEVFNVNSKIRKSVEMLEGAFAKKNISAEVVTEENTDVFADANMFSMVIRNLVSNAIKFTNENGKILVSAKRESDFCKITVQDNGVGISPELVERIFLLESNHSTPGTKGEKGTGLGLILCREFIEKHNGKIWVESEVGKGSRFIFTLPVYKQN
jgi:signal transduction histidine kinase